MKVYIATIVDSQSRNWRESGKGKTVYTEGYSKVFTTQNKAIDFLWEDYLYAFDNYSKEIEDNIGGETRKEFEKCLNKGYAYIKFHFDHIEYTLWENEISMIV